MSVKVYGIYLAYPPMTDLRHEGIGRYLLAFLKAGTTRTDIRFLVACPSWFREELLVLCKSEGISKNSFDLLTPVGTPALLRLYDAYLKYKRRLTKREGKLKRLITFLRSHTINHRSWIERKLAMSRSVPQALLIVVYVTILQSVALPFYVAAKICRDISVYTRTLSTRYAHKIHRWNKLKALLLQPKTEPIFLRLYHYMEEQELELITNQINKLSHVKAWYSPAAFWPSFNRIRAPRLMCVPDVVLREFPVKFSGLGGDRSLEKFIALENAIQGSEHFVSYSSHIKWNTLVGQYAVNPNAVDIIHHAVNDLSRWITVTDFPDNETVSRNYCMQLLKWALTKASNYKYTNLLMNGSVKFLFYASQFRPSKNILTLLRSYEYLLRKRYIAHKLILTGKPHDLMEIYDFIRKHNLVNDVLCLHGLSNSELAACYKLADLAVNPSLSEGGFPFTFTEALSVGTPVVMARIPVTEEIIQDNTLREIMLFDPYNWQSMAQRIEWALANRSQLLAEQQILYSRLSQRSWGDVVNQHIAIFDRISSKVAGIHQHARKRNPVSKPDIRNLDRPLVLVHIPKTAGTAFVNYLKSNMPSADMIAPAFTGDLSSMKNLHFKLYWGHIEYGMLNERLCAAYCLTFLRDPLARVISQYKSWHNPNNLTEYWLSMMSREQVEALRFAQNANLEEFIMSEDPHIVANITDIQTRLLSDSPGSSTMLESAIHNLCHRFYYFGIVERFNESIDLFRRLFNNTCPYKVPEIHENRSVMTVPSLSSAAINRVLELNQNDYALYDFALRQFDEILSKEINTHAVS